MKKYLQYILVCVLLFVGVPGKIYAKDNSERIAEIQKEIAALQSELVSLLAEETEESKTDNIEDQNSIKEDIEIIKEYTLPDSIGWYTRHYMIVKNNTDKTVDVKSNSMAYGADNALLGYADASLDALGAGCISILYEAFETDSTISRYETDISFTESHNESVIQNLSYDQQDVNGGAVFTVTNNGNISAEFVQGYALFFKDGELVSCDSTYFTNDNSELEPGESIRNQLKSYTDFDMIDFYMTGKHYNW